jgi:hypothetical protein
MIAVSGVRSSWLIFAKNSLLARLACSAITRACSVVARWVRSCSIIWLNDLASVPNSSFDEIGSEVFRSPRATLWVPATSAAIGLVKRMLNSIAPITASTKNASMARMVERSVLVVPS